MKIVELTTQKQLETIYPLVHQLNPELTKALFIKRLKVMLAEGYRCIVVKEKTRLLGAAGFWTGTRFWCGAYLDIDNFVVDENSRGRGVGGMLMGWLEAEAKRLERDILVLDAYSVNFGAHRFYHNQGYRILGYHFTKEVNAPAHYHYVKGTMVGTSAKKKKK